jgi:hypothetical protein
VEGFGLNERALRRWLQGRITLLSGLSFILGTAQMTVADRPQIQAKSWPSFGCHENVIAHQIQK